MATTEQLKQARPTAETLAADIRHGDRNARQEAIRQAPLVGTQALALILDIAAGEDQAASRAAWEAVKRIVHHASRSGAGSEAKTANAQLLRYLGSDRPRTVRSEVLILLRYTGDAACITAIAALLADETIREDARLTLEKIPGSASLKALKNALKTAPPDFESNLRQSIKNRNGR